jgi:putative ABC transport system permease protein
MERLGGWMQDVRFGVRQLRRNPAFAAVAILTLGLGVGATTAIFSVLNGVLLKPLPYAEPDELVRVWVGPDRGSMSGLDAFDIQEQLPSVDRLVAMSTSTQTVTGQGEPFLARAGRVSEGILSLFRVAPQLGRDLGFHATQADVSAEVVLGNGLWQRVFGGDPNVVGQTLRVNGVALEIIGVAPAGFAFPADVEMWVPRAIDRPGCQRGCHAWHTVGTLAPGATVARAQTELDALATTLEQTYPDSNTNKKFRVVSLQNDLVGDVSRGLWILLGAVAAVLLIACANVANLLLVRASSRAGEMAVRGAMGATRRRLVRQTLIESAVLATAGGAVGIVFAHFAVRGMRAVSGTSIPRMDAVGVDGAAVLFTLALVGGVTLLFGLSPALRTSAISLADSLGDAGRGALGANNRQRRVLVAAEMGLSVVLLVGAGLFLRTFSQLHAVDLGYETQDVVRFSLSLPSAEYETLDEVRTFYRTLEGQLAGLPGVQSVGSSYGAPLGSGNISGDVLVNGRPEPEPGNELGASVKPVSPDYLATMRIPLLNGRTLLSSDDTDALPVAVVNQAFVREVFPSEDPIGKRVTVTVSFDFGSPEWTIVGVVADIRNRSITTEPVSEIYVSHGQFGPSNMTTSLRTAPGVSIPIDAIRREVQALDSNLPIRGLETVQEAIADDVAPTRFYLFLVAVFAGLALLLAAVGLYGVLAYTVSSRTREIGVRVALGAGRRRIVRMVVLDGLRPALLGVVGGLFVAVLGGRVLESVLYGVEPNDPLVLGTVPVVLLLVAVVAALIPALRAGGMDPSEALRSE